MKPELFKTAMCKAFSSGGNCPFAERCQFAHGNKDLRPPLGKGPTYKTRLCTNVANNGTCPRGEACSFAHSPLYRTRDFITTSSFSTT